MSDTYKKGYNWAFNSYLKGMSLNDIIDYSNNSFDFSDFDRGAIDVVIRYSKGNI